MGRFWPRDAGLPDPRPGADHTCGGTCTSPPYPPDVPPGQGGLLGRRDQARPGDGPARLPGVHAQAPYRRVLPGLRPRAARCAGRDLSAVRHAQRRHHRRHSADGRQVGRSLRAAALARHGRGRVPRGAPQPADRLPRVCPRGRPQGLAGLPGAPPAGERRQLFLRAPARGRVGGHGRPADLAPAAGARGFAAAAGRPVWRHTPEQRRAGPHRGAHARAAAGGLPRGGGAHGARSRACGHRGCGGGQPGLLQDVERHPCGRPCRHVAGRRRCAGATGAAFLRAAGARGLQDLGRRRGGSARGGRLHAVLRERGLAHPGAHCHARPHWRIE